MKVLVYDTTAGNACEVTPLLLRGGCTVVAVSHAETLRKGLESAHTKVHQPIPIAQPNHQPSGLFGRLKARNTRKTGEAARVRHLADLVSQHQPSLVLAIDAELGLPIALRAIASLTHTNRPPVICQSKGSDVLVVPNRKPALQKLVSGSLRQCAGVLVLTSPHQIAVNALVSPQPPVPVWKIPATRDLSQFPHDDATRTAAAESGTPPLILCLRGSRDVYRPEVMLRAAAIASRTAPLRLRLLVDAKLASTFRQLWAGLGANPAMLELITERIPHQSMAAQYAEATIVAQALLNESLGFTAIEAMACGRVVVQPGSDVAREVLNPAQHHLLSGPDAESLAERIVHVLNHPDERQSLESSNRQFALATYDERTVTPIAARDLSTWLSGILNARNATA